MTNTPFSNQVDIVAELYLNYGEDYPELLDIFDLGMPLAVAIYSGGVDADSLTDTGRLWITETFEAICEELGVDKYNDWETLGDMFMYSEYPDAEG